MTDIICPLCGKPNPPDLDECQYCQAPLKSGGFLSSAEGEGEASPIPPFSAEPEDVEGQAAPPESASSLEDSIPDWLKQTEAGFLEPSETQPETPGSDQLSEQIDSLLNPPPSPEPAENAIDDDWLSSLLANAGVGESSQPVPTEETQEPGLDDAETAPEIKEESQGEQPVPTPPEDKPDWLTS